jgi:hypothetical protein
VCQASRRETRLLGILGFIHTTVWKTLFGKVHARRPHSQCFPTSATAHELDARTLHPSPGAHPSVKPQLTTGWAAGWLCVCVQPAESLERGTDNEDEYMISDQELLVNRFISVPRDMGQLNCGSYVSGIVRVRVLPRGQSVAGTKSRVKGQFPRVARVVNCSGVCFALCPVAEERHTAAQSLRTHTPRADAIRPSTRWGALAS